ncbi:pyridoxamine 5'-phosphate oxidase family protein [Streptomyces sp. NPDC059894]|uniref:pyridoxamine 5'-phosphate oxidase family protein n=1 Tax=unclassified Streptomyces TaxID=2593676 RepID=UPI00365518C9
MEITEPPRGPEQRKRDVLDRLDAELDVWVATADGEGRPCLVALWFVWDGTDLWLSTRLTNPTGRNLRRGRRARLAFGNTRDVVLVDGEVETYPAEVVPARAAEAFTARTGWDPRRDAASYAYFRVRPREVQAWREEHEMPGRKVMVDGAWVV